MKIKSVGANQTEVTLANGDIILISYATPIAIYHDKNHYSFASFWHCKDKGCNIEISKTTKKHIDLFFNRLGIKLHEDTKGSVQIEQLQNLIDNDNKS